MSSSDQPNSTSSSPSPVPPLPQQPDDQNVPRPAALRQESDSDKVPASPRMTSKTEPIMLPSSERRPQTPIISLSAKEKGTKLPTRRRPKHRKGQKLKANTPVSSSNRRTVPDEKSRSNKSKKTKYDLIKRKYVVLWDFKAEHDDELDLLKGQEVTIRREEYSKLSKNDASEQSEHSRWRWALVKRPDKTGWVPRAYLELKLNFTQSDKRQVYHGTWFMGEQDQLAARNRLLENDCTQGTFVICAPPEYQTKKGFPSYSLAVRSGKEHPVIKTFYIQRDQHGRYYLEDKNRSRHPNLFALVSALRQRKDLLSTPVVSGPPLKEDERRRDPPPPPARPLRGDLSERGQGAMAKSSWGSFKISLNDLEYKEQDILGKGNFGIVYKGYLLKKKEGRTRVAIKEIMATGEDSQEEFQQEAQMLVMLHHRNLVQFFGWYSSKGQMLMIMEFMDKGALDSYLRQCVMEGNRMSEQAQIDILYQVSAGMKYIESMKVVHRDLAARNCLVSEFGQNTILVKVTDFGLARAVTKEEYYKSRKVNDLPFKWMALESLTHRLFTTKSDVWAFGILIYEVTTHGGLPYLELINEEIQQFLAEGNRLEKPIDMSDQLYKVARTCWVAEPHKRPSFANIYHIFDRMLYKQEFTSQTNN